MKNDSKNPAEYIRAAINFRADVFDAIAERNPGTIGAMSTLGNVKKVLIINASSRSGSSLLFELLKKNPEIYSLSGEGVPFLKLNGFTGDSFPSDEIAGEMTGDMVRVLNLSRDFLSDCSIKTDPNDVIKDPALRDQYIDDLALRFPLQWPGFSFSYERFKNLALAAFNNYRRNRFVFRAEEFYLELVAVLRNEDPSINPYYYDIPAGMVKEKFPGLEVPVGPPNPVLTIEEPPFIVLKPMRKINEQHLFEKTLLLKSSADCYRMGFIETLFPCADIRVVCLTRNPAASINGLYDGWLSSRGFFSRNLRSLSGGRTASEGNILSIQGYSERYEWGGSWWKYELPLGWEKYSRSRLEEVCAFQWCSANTAVQEYKHTSGKQNCQVRYENIIANADSRKHEIEKIIDIAGIPQISIHQMSLNMLPVMQATYPPFPFRWKKKEDMLKPLLESPSVNLVCAQLGYDRARMEEWL
ncbi:MAG: hypothetical protein PHE58_05280 [Candidatus Omnitrophica bacterium]|nr:hypothetical protein [Candidatus Omnitrophota bacterium]